MPEMNDGAPDRNVTRAAVIGVTIESAGAIVENVDSTTFGNNVFTRRGAIGLAVQIEAGTVTVCRILKVGATLPTVNKQAFGNENNPCTTTGVTELLVNVPTAARI